MSTTSNTVFIDTLPLTDRAYLIWSVILLRVEGCTQSWIVLYDDLSTDGMTRGFCSPPLQILTAPVPSLIRGLEVFSSIPVEGGYFNILSNEFVLAGYPSSCKLLVDSNFVNLLTSDSDEGAYIHLCAILHDDLSRGPGVARLDPNRALKVQTVTQPHEVDFRPICVVDMKAFN